ncbi:MAG: cation-translocating P-type ATPase [Peptococcaceae bacterium]|nr:cation-translocating P-type ATPase [Peptococcaceae bacterium]
MTLWYEKAPTEALQELASNAETGLSSQSVAERQKHYGKNQFEEHKPESVLRKILHTLRDVTTLILVLAAILSLAMGLHYGEGYIEFFVIIGIVILNITLSVTQERSAEKSLAALMNLNSPTSLVIRNGKRQAIDSIDLVPGDILLLETGDLISADARLLESTNLEVDESALTGESIPSEKNPTLASEQGDFASAQPCTTPAQAHTVSNGDRSPSKIPVADQNNMVFSGCLVTAGRAKSLITAIGMETQMGTIAKYLNNTQKLKTPLQTRLDKIGKTISLIAIIAAVLVFCIDFWRGAELWETIFFAVTLAVAAVPETLSLIVTLILAHGVTEMVKKNALIRKLPAVETLGSTSVICTDKTGTLTQNRMTITRLWQNTGPSEGSTRDNDANNDAINDAINDANRFGHNDNSYRDTSDFTPTQTAFLNKLALVCNATAEEAPDNGVKIIGDPTETAIIRLLHQKGGDKNELEKTYPRVAEIPFSSERKMMTTIHRDPQGGFLVLTKGAYDKLPIQENPQAHNVHDAFARDALRIIALGSNHIDTLPEEGALTGVERDLHFEGMIGIIDPPRPECAAAIATAKTAGIRTVMITGDHAATAGAIARQLGLLTESDQIITGIELAAMSDTALIENVALYSVYARVSPEDKIRIVQAWQEHDDVVAMTGDGVNDAPALKAADVGVAMGINGTEVAKSTSDIILTDDNFSTIVDTVHKGRDVFSNIRKTVYFLLVCNFSEIVIILGSQLIGMGMPLTPIMLLLINILGDGIPGLQLAYETSDPRIMQRHPIRRNESLFEGLQFVIVKQTIALVIVAWIAYYLGAYVFLTDAAPPSHIIGQTMTFLVVGWTSILHVFTVRSRKSIFRRTIKDTPRIVISAAAMIALFALFVLIPQCAAIFGMVTIRPVHWLIVIGLSIVPTITAEIGKALQNQGEAQRYKRRLVQHTLPDS